MEQFQPAEGDNKRFLGLKRKLARFKLERVADRRQALQLAFMYWSRGNCKLALAIFELLLGTGFNGNYNLWFDVVVATRAAAMLGSRNAVLAVRLEEIDQQCQSGMLLVTGIETLVTSSERNCPPPSMGWVYESGAISVSLSTMLYVEALGITAVSGVPISELFAQRLASLRPLLG